METARQILINEEIKRNVSTVFLLHNLNINYTTLFKYNFIDAFVDNLDTLQLGEHSYEVHLLFKVGTKLPEHLYQNQYYIAEYDFDGYFVLVFKYPDEYKKFYDCVLDSKYSAVPLEQRDIVSRVTNHGDGKWLVPTASLVINKSDYLKDCFKEMYDCTDPVEYWKNFDFYKEILNENEYIGESNS